MAHRKSAGISHNPHELSIIARADRHSAFLFAGRDSRHRIECESELEARAAAQRLADEHRKPAIVYAIAGGSAAMVGTVQPRGQLARPVAQSGSARRAEQT